LKDITSFFLQMYTNFLLLVNQLFGQPIMCFVYPPETSIILLLWNLWIWSLQKSDISHLPRYCEANQLLTIYIKEFAEYQEASWYPWI